MTPELEKRWKEKLSPFNGVTLNTEDEFGLTKLRQVLVEIVHVLEHGANYSRVEYFDDWHAHDGYITDSTSITWQGIHNWFSTNESLFRQRYDDDFVSIGIYPLSFEWYLRIQMGDNLDDISQPTDLHNVYCDFDLTCDVSLARILKDIIQEKTGIKIEWINAKIYFDTICAGGSSFLPGEPIPPGIL